MTTYLLIALGAAAGGFAQGLSGFAFGLVAMSFWVWTIEPKLAAALVLFGSLTGQIIGAASVRRKLNLRLLMPYIVGGAAGVPFGTAILPYLDAALFKGFVGLLLIVWCPAMLFAAKLPPVKFGGHTADGIAGFLGGICGGIAGFTGAIPTLWCALRRLPKDEQRGIVQNFNLATLTCAMAAYLAGGHISLDMLPMFAVVAVALAVPVLFGAKLYAGISEAAFRRIVLGLLFASGVVLFSSAAISLSGRG
jgi:uncharacterized membrane protein YfcA